MSKHADPEKLVQAIKCRTRRKYASEEKIRIVLEGLNDDQSISTVCRRESNQPAHCNSWSKEFLSVRGTKQLCLKLPFEFNRRHVVRSVE